MLIDVFSNGFGIADKEDDMVEEGNEGGRKLVCGTAKEKHKAKNLKTAGKCVSTPARLEKYAWPQWDWNLRPLEY